MDHRDLVKRAMGLSSARHTPRRPTPGQDALSRAVSQLQRESEVTMALETESASVNQQLALQVASLQRGFHSLADAVLEELETVREESRRWPEERSAWVKAMADMREDMGRQLESMRSKYEDSLAALDKAWDENQRIRAENDLLHERLSQLETGVEHLNRHMDQTQRGLSAVQQGADDLRSGVVELTSKVEARETIHRTLGRTIADAEARLNGESVKLREDTTSTCRALQTDLEGVASDVEAVRVWCQQLDAAHRNHVADTQHRLGTVEAGPDLTPVVGAVQALEGRLGQLARTTEASAARLEAGLGRLNADAAENHAKVENANVGVTTLRRAMREHHEALIRASSVFAGALKMSSPISEVSLVSSLAPVVSGVRGDGPVPTVPYTVLSRPPVGGSHTFHHSAVPTAAGKVHYTPSNIRHAGL